MTSKLYLIIICIAIPLIFSCSENSTKNIDEISCQLISETDSNNFINRYYFDEKKVDFIERYNSIDAKEPFRVINYRYNILNKLIAIDVYNDKNVLISTDSLKYSNFGFLKEMISYSGLGKPVQKEKYSVSTSNNITKIEIFKIEGDTEKLKSITYFTYDDAGRVIREEYNLESTDYREVTNYSFDNNKNPYNYSSPLLIFKKNNVISKETTYYLTNGTVSNTITNYRYEYNSNGYPISKSTLNSDNNSEFINYYNYNCD